MKIFPGNMKKIVLFWGVASLLAACTAQLETPVETIDEPAMVEEQAPVLYASISEEAQTKVYLDEDYKVLWTADDRISVFNKNTYNQQYSFDGATGDNAGTFSIVEDGKIKTSNEIDNLYAVYPYNESTSISNTGVLTVNFPAAQTYSATTFGQGSNTMVAVTDGTNMQFKNACGFLMFKLYGTGVNVKSVSLRGNNHEKIAGEASISMSLGGTPSVTMSTSATEEIMLTCTDAVTIGTTADNYTEFWFVIPPVTFSTGFSVTVTDEDGKVYSKSTTSSIEIVRSYAKKMAPIQIEFPIQFADPTVKAICVNNWDLNGDGELSYREAAEVEYLVAGPASGPNVFYNNTSITSFDEFQYFTNCNRLASFIEGNTYFGVFEGCTSLVSITLPPSLYAIGDNAFKNCTSLENLVIPASVGHICSYAFYGDNKLMLHFDSTNPTDIHFYPCYPQQYAYAFGPQRDNGALLSLKVRAIYVPTDEAVTACKSLYEWAMYADRILLEGTPYPEVSIELNRTSLHLEVGETRTLSASVFPQFATDKRVEFSSSAPGIVTLANTGVTYDNGEAVAVTVDIAAIAEGTATITTTAEDGTVINSCVVEVRENGTFAIPEAVDLGLSVKWASFNVGCGDPEDSGFRYAWGEIEPKNDYSWETYKWSNGTAYSLTKYNPGANGTWDGKRFLDMEDDVANVKLGGSWRIPTYDEWLELENTDNCTWEWISMGGVGGFKVSGRKTGYTDRWIFLPAILTDGSSTAMSYWSSEASSGSPEYALTMSLWSQGHCPSNDHRCYGFFIRPVKPQWFYFVMWILFKNYEKVTPS